MKILLRKFFRFLPFTLILVPFVADAHVGVGQASGFWLGFLHPLSGLDHIFLMVGAGIWARQTGGHAYWVLPLVFAAAVTVHERGAEMSASQGGMIYASGFIFAVLFLYIAGIVLGSLARRKITLGLSAALTR